MATTIDKSIRRSHVPYLIYEEQWSTIDGALTNLSWLAADGPALVPFKVEMEVITPPTDQSVLQLQRTTGSDVAASRTISLRVKTAGSLTGAVVLIRLMWLEQANGGIS